MRAGRSIDRQESRGGDWPRRCGAMRSSAALPVVAAQVCAALPDVAAQVCAALPDVAALTAGCRPVRSLFR